MKTTFVSVTQIKNKLEPNSESELKLWVQSQTQIRGFIVVLSGSEVQPASVQTL